MSFNLSDPKKNKFYFFLFSSVFLGLLCTAGSFRFLEVSNIDQSSFLGSVYFYLFCFFYYSFGALAVSIPFYLISLTGWVKLSKFLFITVCAVFFTFFIADTFVYQQFRMHLNPAMLQMTLFGGGQVVAFTAGMIFQIILYIVLCMTAVYFGGYVINRFFRKTGVKTLLSTVFFLILGLITTQVIFGVGFAKQNVEITQFKQSLPYVRALRFNKTLIKLGVVKKEDVYSVKVGGKAAVMKYPPNLNCEGGKRFNIVFIFVDALRYDMVNSETMPITNKFAQSSVIFKNHYSGGINTRHGIFSLFTGIPGSYWETSLQTKSGSALISALQKSNYEIGIFTGAPITMPEFNQTIFATLKNPRLQSRGNTVLERDQAAVSDFGDWLKKLPKDKRFFSFIFLDNVHAAAFPENKENIVFQPYWKNVNQLELNNDFDPVPFFNRYKNSVLYADKQIGTILELLAKEIDMDNTVVVIGSDHGEEFNDTKLNYWGHNGNFTKYQAQTPFIVKWPGKKHVEVEYRTSMLDVVPTILPEVLGCKNPIKDYSVGTNLFEPNKARKFVYSSNYSKDAFIEENRIVLINELGVLSYFDKDYRPSQDKTIPSYIGQVLEETTRFMK